ncbi:hypothetical protein ACWAT4_32715 [Bradyrhizobium manausense]
MWQKRSQARELEYDAKLRFSELILCKASRFAAIWASLSRFRHTFVNRNTVAAFFESCALLFLRPWLRYDALTKQPQLIAMGRLQTATLLAVASIHDHKGTWRRSFRTEAWCWTSVVDRSP